MTQEPDKVESAGLQVRATLPAPNDMILGPLSNRLHLISFTGSHGVGKSTTAKSLLQKLNSVSSEVSAVLCESCATKWFRDQQAKTPELKTYDDLDRITVPLSSCVVSGKHRLDVTVISLRLKMQLELPTVLRGMLADLINTALETNGSKYATETYLLVDRWFVDISAYTRLKLPGIQAEFVHSECKSQARQLLDWVTHACITNRHQLYLTNVLIPSKTCEFVAKDDKPNRGTDPATDWEREADQVMFEMLYPARIFTVTKSALDARVDEIWQRVRVPYEEQNWLGG